MTHDPKQSISMTWKKKKKKKKKPFSCIFFCSGRSPVNDDDDVAEEEAAAAAEAAPEEQEPRAVVAPRSGSSKRNFCLWFSSMRLRKKMKTVPAGAPEIATHHHRALPAAHENHYFAEGGGYFLNNRTNKIESNRIEKAYDQQRSRELEFPTWVSIKNNNVNGTPSSSNAASFRMVTSTPSNLNNSSTRSCASASASASASAGGGDALVIQGTNYTFATWAGLWIMIAALTVMVFSGRATAVIYLLSCLYFVPHR